VETIIIEVVSHYAPSSVPTDDSAAHKRAIEQLARDIKRFARARADKLLCGDVYVYSVIGERK